MKLRHLILPAVFLLQSFSVFAQDAAPDNWFNLDKDTDKVMGVSTELAYKKLLAGKKPKKEVVVAIIDSGVQADHEDLEGVMWKNPGEIAGNGIDDDGNGYVDDVYGWNFIGGADGSHVNHDTYEITRLYAKLKDKSKRSKAEQKQFEEIEKAYKKKLSEARMNLMGIQAILDADKTLVKHFGKEDYELEDVKAIESEDESITQAKQIITSIWASYPISRIRKYGEYMQNQVDYGLNVEFSPRNIVGDNYEDLQERIYGNNDVEGPDASHGTHVAGIVAAQRDNDLGMMGVAHSVRIMAVRAVPNGDERDKDIANAIRYAVDNGAHIINMSFGKAYAEYPKVVQDAIKYAEKKDVLLVHAAGNNAEDNDAIAHYPSKYYGKSPIKGRKTAKNWLDVGALSWKPGKDSPAEFSNYGKVNVDVFAPGVDIYSTVPTNKYEANSGTSMAAPVVSGVAALVLAYYPELSAEQLREIIMESAIPLEFSVKKPGTEISVPFSDLSVTGAVVNVYKALELADKTKGKRKS